MKITNFKSIVNNYKIIFFDAYGVIKTYQNLIPGIEKTFTYLEDHNIDFFVLTNDASRGPRELAEKYWKMGLESITENKIISSGMLAREYLRYKVRKGTVAYLGTPNSAHYLETLGLKTLSIRDLKLDHCDDVNALVLLDDEGFDWNHDINKAVNLLRQRNIPIIVANTDKAYPVSKRKVAIAIGSLGDLLGIVVKKHIIRFGKPSIQMFNYAYEHVQENRIINKKDILMVGDTLSTDIVGGNKFGIDTALVLTGNTLEARASLLIETTGIVPDYICHSAAIY